MHPALDALLGGRLVDTPTWTSFWDALAANTLDPREPAAVLASLSSSLDDHATLANVVRSLHERRTDSPIAFAGAVNIVGTGGGPPTFNVSTAAAFVAAALGARVVKTGSRAYTSACGSLDLLDRLGIPLTKSYDETGEMLDTHGVAFAGHFVYPVELTTLARRIAPLPMRSFGRILNTLGPFLPALPLTTQLTGVSARTVLPVARHLARTVRDRSIWLCVNDIGADELVSFTDNVIYPGHSNGEMHIGPRQLGTAPGEMDDLRPVADPARVVEHFLDVVDGQAGGVVTETVSVNAAAMVCAAGLTRDWKEAVTAAGAAMRRGEVVALVEQVRSRGVVARRKVVAIV